MTVAVEQKSLCKVSKFQNAYSGKKMTGRSQKYQHGASLLGWLMAIFLIGSATSIGTKLIPLFVDHYTISTLMDKMSMEDGLADKRTYDIIELLENRMKLNNIRNLSLKDKLVIERSRNGVEVRLQYEVRTSFFRNVDMVASFHKEIWLRE